MNRSLPAIVVLLGSMAAAQQPASKPVIWRADFETGDTSQWRSAPKSDGVKVVQQPVREGKYALRIDGTNAAKRGDLDRIEFQHLPENGGTTEGAERYFGWSVFIPQKFTESHHAVGYFETRNSWRQVLSFEAHGEDVLFTTRVPYSKHWEGKGKLTAPPWHDFALHVFWSRDPTKGFVEMWFDGEQVVKRVSTATLRDENPPFFQIGFMRATSDVPESIVIDHVVEGTTLAAVTPPPLQSKAGSPAAK